MFDQSKKQFRDRANRARRGLLNEKKSHGYINDGSGKRYRAPVYFVLAGEPDKAMEFYSWFQEEFPDDVGEPIFTLYWALAEFRAGDPESAIDRLLDAMLQNVYMIPFLIGDEVRKYDIWHCSNRVEPDYLFGVEDFLTEPTQTEREWMSLHYNSRYFSTIRQKYVDTYAALKTTKDFESRSGILNSWDSFLSSCSR